MPALANGLNLGKPKPSLAERLAGQKRKKTLFDNDSDDEDSATIQTDAPSNLGELSTKSKKPTASSRAPAPTQPPKDYKNLSALHDAKKRAVEAERIDSSIYDYDNVYDTFSAASKPKQTSNVPSGPKYMTSLMNSAEVRKRDQLRAKEKMLQKEREAEGDEYADKEKFVTGAYKKQQEEMRRLEEEEAKREAEEEERRKKGGGMSGFYQNFLKREDQRHEEIQKAAEQRAAQGPSTGTNEETETEKTESQVAAELNAKGASIAVNDEGVVVDKRDLLSAGLNVAKKPKTASTSDADKAKTASHRQPEWSRSNAAKSARESQRERQTRMLAAQLEEMQRKQAEEEEMERKETETKVKSKVTDEKVMGAKERYLARKKEREEEAKRAKNGG